jgi:outer membrane protein assembly factor BamB
MTTRLLLASVLSLSLPLSFAGAADWPRFRGPNGTGTADGALPTPDADHLLWKVPIPGKGVSSPVVVGGRVYLQSASDDGTKRYMICVSVAEGKIAWATEVPGRPVGPKDKHAKNSLASGTPTVDGDRVFGVFWDGLGEGISLHAFDPAGKPVWSKPLGDYVSQHGPGCSPVVYKGLVFVNVDDDKHAELVAFDAKSGERKWVAPRKPYRASYSTPFVLERPGKPVELLLGTTTAITAYEPATGKVVWSYDVPWPKGQMPLRVVGSPLYAGGLVVCFFGDGGGSRYGAAIDPNGGQPVKVWEMKRDVAYVPCSLAKDDLLFWVADKPGVAYCAELRTGKVVWDSRLFGKDVTSSPVMVGDQILSISETGEVAVFKAAREFDRVYTGSVGEPVAASPAVADGKLFVRGANHLFCYGKK